MPIRYVPYVPEPVEGQALLRNVTRTRRLLAYHDSDGVERRIARGLPLYDVEITETVGDPHEAAHNLLLRGDCLAACAYLKDQGQTVDLVYIDPPFASAANYAKTVYLRRNPHAAEALAHAEEELDDEALRSFEETMYGDIWDKETYLSWLYERLVAIKAVMSDTASIYLHLDKHIVHYAKVMMDEIFGESNFRDEIIWKRTSAHGGANRFAPVHDTILVYVTGEDYIWNQVYQTYDEEYVEAFFTHLDEDGRRWRRSDLTGAGASKGESSQPWGGYNPTSRGRHWAVPTWAVEEALVVLGRKTEKAATLNSVQKLEALNQAGMIHIPAKIGGAPHLKKYLDSMPGTPALDVIVDIPPPHNISQERVDYPTQKPLALLERIVAASTNATREDGSPMVVADFFGGSGVTAKAAHKLGRRFVHADVGVNSVQTVRDGLREAGAAFTVAEIRDGVALFRNPAQTMDKLRTLIPGLAAVKGLPEPWAGALVDPKAGTVPVLLPDLMDPASRVFDAVALRKIVERLPDLPDGTTNAVVYYVDRGDDLAAQDAALSENPTEIALDLRDLKGLLAEAVVEDEAHATVSGSDAAGYTVRLDRYDSQRLREQIHTFNEKGSLPKQASLYDGDAPEAEDDEAPAPKKRGKKATATIALSDEGLELVEAVSLDCSNAEGPWTSDAEVRVDKKGFASGDGAAPVPAAKGKAKPAFWDGTVRSARRPLRMRVRNVSGDEIVVPLP